MDKLTKLPLRYIKLLKKYISTYTGFLYNSKAIYNTKEKSEKVLKIAEKIYQWIKSKFKNN